MEAEIELSLICVYSWWKGQKEIRKSEYVQVHDVITVDQAHPRNPTVTLTIAAHLLLTRHQGTSPSLPRYMSHDIRAVYGSSTAWLPARQNPPCASEIFLFVKEGLSISFLRLNLARYPCSRLFPQPTHQNFGHVDVTPRASHSRAVISMPPGDQ
jgi:hypothetical protein